MSSLSTRNTAFLKQQDIIAAVFFIAAIILFCWKCPFSIGYEEEGYYLAIPFRLTMGDSLLTDEWHLSQLTGFLLYLPVKAYVSFIGSTEGIILFFRYLFVLLQSCVSVIIYCRLRKYGMFSILAAVIYFLYIPNTIMSLNYNSMGLTFVMLAGLLMATTKKFSKSTYYLVGLFTACAVLCNPAFAFVYFVYCISVIIFYALKNKKKQWVLFSETSFSFKTWLWISFGIFTLATVFFIFLFSRTSLKEIINNFPMLLSDPQYQFSSVGSGAQNIFSIKKSLVEIIKINPYLFVAFVILLIAMLIDKKRTFRRTFYLSSVSVIFIAYIVVIIAPAGSNEYKFAVMENILYCTLPLALVGITCYILSVNKDKQTFIFLWVLGVLYAVCLDITSDLGTLSSIQAFALLDIAGVIFMKNLIDEIKKEKEQQLKIKYKQKNSSKYNKDLTIKCICLVLFATLFVQICFEAYLDIKISASCVEYAYSNSTEKLTEKIQAGPLKGLKTTPKIEKIYTDTLSDLSVIKQKPKGPVLIVGDFEWPYLYLNKPYAAYSTYILDWFFASQNRLPQYYKLHPNKMPKYIYISKIVPRLFQYKPEMAKKVLDDVLDKYNCTVEKNGKRYMESDVGYIVEIINHK